MFHLLFWGVVLATFIVTLALILGVYRLLTGRWFRERSHDENLVIFKALACN
jgi:multisubunit Na+/H+ antiporter MnhF subunit